MQEEFIQLQGKEPGPVSVVIGGVHGNERSGILALEKLLPILEIERGTVWFGFGNPKAIEKNVRATETNLNRMFKSEEDISTEEKISYEYTRARYIKTILDQADALLDVHSSFTVGSQPFLICERNAKDIAQYLPVSLVVSGFDTVEPGGTDYYMNVHGKIGICMECGYLGDDSNSKIAEEGILAFLQSRGHLSGSPKKYEQEYVQMDSLYMTETDFKLAKDFQDFEDIQAGTLIGMDGDKEIYAEKDCVILFARDRPRSKDEAFLLGEKKKSLA